jgi:hypothetical protein
MDEPLNPTSAENSQGNILPFPRGQATKLTKELFENAGIKVADRQQYTRVPAPTPFGANARSKQYFENEIPQAWQRQVRAIIATGHLLNQAADELDRDDFAALKLPFTVRTAQMLRRIAGHPILSANHGSLPACWRTLYELTKLPDDLLRVALRDGRIHPKLQRKDIRTEVQLLQPLERSRRQPLGVSDAPPDLTPQQLRCGIEKLGAARFRQEVLPPDWIQAHTDIALSLAKPERLITMLERQVSPTNKAAQKALRELKHAMNS